MSLDIITKHGKLLDIFPFYDRYHIQHADEVLADMSKDVMDKGIHSEMLKNDYFTADFAMYTVENGIAYLYLARGKDNLLFDNIAEACKQLSSNKNYKITERKDIDSVINSDTTLRFFISDLGLKSYGREEYGTFDFTVDNPYLHLHAAQMPLVERIFGKGQVFEASMRMLKIAGSGYINVYDILRSRITDVSELTKMLDNNMRCDDKAHINLLNADYVKRNVPEGGAIARLCMIGKLYNNTILGISREEVRFYMDRPLNIEYERLHRESKELQGHMRGVSAKQVHEQEMYSPEQIQDTFNSLNLENHKKQFMKALRDAYRKGGK